MTAHFWEKKPLQAFTQEEWESLCDGCGKCCLQKLEDENTGKIHYTRIACRLLDTDTCQCSDYLNRKRRVPECIQLTLEDLRHFHWLPETCAYRLVYEGRPLYHWHPLLSGNRESVHEAGASVKAIALSELSVPEEAWEDYIIPATIIDS
ncbi:YcgN family cysteine cluster protein [Candidatus Sororendozoicomonas aggregata]|uniref:YcgN family cysteine cluster protein n=1 Tax=Candidatus Sororendozoicomonas aggregata TaxID=3073239 RepID=UPI002ED5243D